MKKRFSKIFSILGAMCLFITPIGDVSFATNKPLSKSQTAAIQKELDKHNIPKKNQEKFLKKIESNQELDSSKYFKKNKDKFNLEVELNSDENKSIFKSFDDGSFISIEVEDASPEEISTYGLTYNGKKISGSNGLATQTYYINTRPHQNNSAYTVLTNAYAINTSIAFGTIENETIKKHRTWEDKNNPVWVDGYAKFNYFGNQWISVWQSTGGVRTKIKNNKLSVSLY